jgi:hypothetical protein
MSKFLTAISIVAGIATGTFIVLWNAPSSVPKPVEVERIEMYVNTRYAEAGKYFLKTQSVDSDPKRYFRCEVSKEFYEDVFSSVDLPVDRCREIKE